MITAVAVVPSAPVLLAENLGRVDPVPELRRDAVAAVRRVGASAERVVLLTAADRDPLHTRSSLGRRVGVELVGGAGARCHDMVEVPWDATVSDCRSLGSALAEGDSTTLVVVADGSAARGEKAPGHLDERSFALDEAVIGGLRDPDPERLLALDPSVCADVLLHGRAPLQVAAAALQSSGGDWATDVRAEDPFGVLYVIATLRRT